ncbi:sensor histidine kinase [Flexithrix dorotheae]|uniref:sensor histidine kinase n=1 Tax=Flexithrix dorotheae TaxID=70993 RepID=UPI00035E9DF5|nr:ATP-binding protein [Flexithrix dorotheae]
MRTLYFSILIFFLCPFLLKGQESSRELEKKLNSSLGLERLSTIASLMEAYNNEKKPKKAIEQGESGLDYAKTLRKNTDKTLLERGKADIQIQFGRAYFIQNIRDKALAYFSEALETCEKIGYNEGAEEAISFLEEMEQTEPENNTPKWWETIKGEMNSWELSKKFNEKKKHVILNHYEKTAQKYETEENYEQATIFYLKTIKYYEEAQDTIKVLETYKHIAELFLAMGNTEAAESALSYAEKIENSSPTIKPKEVGILPSKKEIITDTVITLKPATPEPLKIDPKDKPKQESSALMDALKLEEELLTEMKNMELEKEEKKALEIKTEEYKNLAETLSDKGEFATAAKYYKLYIQAREKLHMMEKKAYFDSLRTTFKIEANADLIEKLKVQKEKQELEIESQKAEISKAALLKNILLVGLVVTIGLVILFYWLFTSKRKSHKQVVQTLVQLDEAHQKLKSTQTKLVESEKMASLGQLTAGISHEFNNPLNFISSNIYPLKLNIADLKKLFGQYAEWKTADDLKSFLNRLDKEKEALDFDFIWEEIKVLLEGIDEGSNRIAELVNGLKQFVRLDEDTLKRINIHEGLDTTLLLMKNNLKNGIQVKKEYDVALPEIDCYPGALNQVFMNILTNAVQAIESKSKENGLNGNVDKAIIISTKIENEVVKISIKDNGNGIPDEIKSKIFDPFFTTKEVGEGTGLGLSIAFGVIERHHGQIEVISKKDEGCEFLISLPVNQN